MKTTESNKLIPLAKEELQNTNGGFLPIVVAVFEAYIALNGLATIAGMTVAYIENKLK